MKNSLDVIFVQKIFPSYRKPIFDALKKKIDFKFLTGKNNSGIKTTKGDYIEYIPSIQYGEKDTQVLLFPLYKIIRYRPKIVICELALGILNLPVIVFTCKLLSIKIAFWSHGYDRKIGFKPDERKADKYRLKLMKWVDALIVYSRSDQELLQKNLPKTKVFTAQNTLDTVSMTKIKKKLEDEGKENIKKRLRIKHEFNIIYIGRMIASKKPEFLVEIHSKLQSYHGINIGVHFVGDGEMLSVVKNQIHTKGLSKEDFYFHGPIYDDEKSGELLFVNDLLVNPGYLGLSINHAFCFGCPVVSFETKDGYPAHSPEVEYLVHNKTGYLLKEHTVEAMADTINVHRKDDKLQSEFRENIQYTVEHVFPMEKMVNGFLECIQFLTRDEEHESQFH